MSTLYLHTVHKNPLYIYYLNGFFLDGGCSIAAPPSSGSPPGYAAVRRRKDLASLGLPRGTPLAGFPRTPSPRSPTKGYSPRAEASLRSALSS